jgi:hypothetical protein
LNKALAACLGAGFIAVSGPAAAHFLVMEPATILNQSPRGDPQKLGPCGGTTPDPGTVSGAITAVTGGSMLHIKLKETVFHPGHYRVALAVNSWAELPDDPEPTTRQTERGPWSVSGKIATTIKPPLLADGLFQHTTAPAADNLWETDVKLPNINCSNCTLQIIQWMNEHGYNPDGGYTYHHCAALKITADPKKPIDRAWPGQGARR